VETGSGATLAGIDYFSHIYGTQHIFSLLATEYGLYWADVINRAIVKYSLSKQQEILSDTKEQHDFSNYVMNYYDLKTRSLVPFQYRWITSVHDRLNNEVIFSFANNIDRIVSPNPPINISITYNENLDEFTTFNSFSPLFMQG